MTTASAPDRDRGSHGEPDPGPERDPNRKQAGARGFSFGQVLVPDELPAERRARRRRRLLLLAAAAAVAAVAVHLWNGSVLEEAVSPWWAAVGGGAGRGDAVAADTSTSPGSSGRPFTADPRITQFRERAVELMAAVRRFRERSEDHRLGRIECSELARGFETVDRTMVDLARVYLGVRDRLTPNGQALYDRAMARADSAGRSFAESRCERAP